VSIDPCESSELSADVSAANYELKNFNCNRPRWRDVIVPWLHCRARDE